MRGRVLACQRVSRRHLHGLLGKVPQILCDRLSRQLPSHVIVVHQLNERFDVRIAVLIGKGVLLNVTIRNLLPAPLIVGNDVSGLGEIVRLIHCRVNRPIGNHTFELGKVGSRHEEGIGDCPNLILRAFGNAL